MKNKSTWAIIALVITIGVLLYMNKASNSKLTTQYDMIKALQDTTHFYKTELGNQGAYISVISGDKEGLMDLLQTQASKNTVYKDMIDSLKKRKDITSISNIQSETKVIYQKEIDTVYRNLSFRDSVRTKWYDLDVNIKNSQLNTALKVRDELNLTLRKIDNKGLWTGSTLTAFANSKNPNTSITGVTSISTVVEKPQLHIAPTIGVGLNTDLHGQNMRLGYQAGISITF